MTTFDAHAQLAAARAVELRREASHARLVALVADRLRAAVRPGPAECCA